MYMLPMSSEWYGLAPHRVWWKPWRYDLIAAPLYGEWVCIAHDISKAECIAIMKMLGAVNVDN